MKKIWSYQQWVHPDLLSAVLIKSQMLCQPRVCGGPRSEAPLGGVCMGRGQDQLSLTI